MSPAATAVIVLGRWEMLDRIFQGRWQHLGDPAFDAYVEGQLDEAVTLASAGGRAVVICTAPFYQGQERPQGGIWPENDPARVDRFNQLVRQVVRAHPGVVLFDLNALVSPGGRFASEVRGDVIRAEDGVHFSPEGGVFVAARLLPLVAKAGRAASVAGTVG